MFKLTATQEKVADHTCEVLLYAGPCKAFEADRARLEARYPEITTFDTVMKSANLKPGGVAWLTHGDETNRRHLVFLLVREGAESPADYFAMRDCFKNVKAEASSRQVKSFALMMPDDLHANAVETAAEIWLNVDPEGSVTVYYP